MKIFTAASLLDRKLKLREKQAVAVAEGKIVEVGSLQEIVQKFPEAVREDFPQAVLLPGLVNSHTELEFFSFDPPLPKEGASATARFLALWEQEKKLTPAERRTFLREGIDRLLRSGTTSVGDAGDYVGVVNSLPKNSLRMVLYARLFTSAEASVSIDYEALMTIVDDIAALDTPHLRPGIFPYAPYTVSSPLLKILAQNARQTRAALKIRAAESFAEMQFFYESTGEIADLLFPKLKWEKLPPPHRKTPVQFLDSIGFLSEKPALLGGTQLADGDIQVLAKRGAKVILTPRSQQERGVPPVKKLRKAGVPLGLGTDSVSKESLSLWDEMRFLLKNEKDFGLSAEDVLRMATLGGAEVLGMEKEIGSLEAGKRADLIAVRLPRKLSSDPLATLIYETNETEAVFVDGEKIKIQ